jgi:hypothetical protein
MVAGTANRRTANPANRWPKNKEPPETEMNQAVREAALK